MRNHRITKQQLADLRGAHRATRDVREAYRINAVLLLGKGRTPPDVADALLLDLDTVRGLTHSVEHVGLSSLNLMPIVHDCARS
jgi:hypothetical protein